MVHARTQKPGSVQPGEFWLVRHALPLVASGICYGQLDMAADAQATLDCAQALAKALPQSFSVVTSPLQRCEQLAKALRDLRPDLTFKTEKNLQEMDFGQWEGRLWDAIPRAEMDAWTANFADYAVGNTGESVSQFMARIAVCYDSLQPGSRTLWITHAGVIRAANLLARGVRHMEHANQWPRYAPGYGQWCKLAFV